MQEQFWVAKSGKMCIILNNLVSEKIGFNSDYIELVGRPETTDRNGLKPSLKQLPQKFNTDIIKFHIMFVFLFKV